VKLQKKESQGSRGEQPHTAYAGAWNKDVLCLMLRLKAQIFSFFAMNKSRGLKPSGRDNSFPLLPCPSAPCLFGQGSGNGRLKGFFPYSLLIKR